MSNSSNPTPDPEINALQQDILTGAQTILTNQFVGMYLEGSLATGAFDEDSDVDFVIATDGEISPALFMQLQAMHNHISSMPSRWARVIEGSYVPLSWLSHPDATPGHFPNIQRGPSERLILDLHNNAWITHRYVLHEHGIVLAGPVPSTFMAPISPDDLRRAIRALQDRWLASILADPETLRPRGYQCYVVLTLCRMLYTMQHGTVVPKPVAARWAEDTLDLRWQPLITRAWIGRHSPGDRASAQDIMETQAFVRQVKAQTSQIKARSSVTRG